MKKKNRNGLIVGTVLLVSFVLWTVAVKFIDVQPIGPEGSVVGFATVNRFVHGLTGANMSLYNITDLLGLVPLGFVMGFGTLGLVQWIKRKKLSLVDKEIWFLALTYALTIGFYILFELVVINYRPVLVENELEASFPSSHTMLACVTLATAIFSTHLFTKNKLIKAICVTFAGLLMFVIVVGRLASGVHWFTDIIGGVFLSASIVMLYLSLVKTFANKEEVINEDIQ